VPPALCAVVERVLVLVFVFWYWRDYTPMTGFVKSNL
jgi:hypothetical protein